jgi:hypothetical protein
MPEVSLPGAAGPNGGPRGPLALGPLALGPLMVVGDQSVGQLVGDGRVHRGLLR